MESTTESFGALLRHHRLAAALTQEGLAERAGISATGIAALEAGRRRAPRLTTVRLLSDALALDADARTALRVAASGASAVTTTNEPINPASNPATGGGVVAAQPASTAHVVSGRHRAAPGGPARRSPTDTGPAERDGGPQPPASRAGTSPPTRPVHTSPATGSAPGQPPPAWATGTDVADGAGSGTGDWGTGVSVTGVPGTGVPGTGVPDGDGGRGGGLPAGGLAPGQGHLAPTAGGKTALVGRSEELAALRAAWDRGARLIVVSGESGIGKTRLVAELAAELSTAAAAQAAQPAATPPLPLPSRAGRFTALWGRCTLHRVGVYEPFVGPVRAVLAGAPDAASFVGQLARLVPELVIERGWADSARFAGPDVEQRLLFDAVATLFGRLGPTLLIIDDLQWADTATLALLAHLVTDERLGEVTVLCTVRSTDQDSSHAAALADLGRRTSLTRVQLQGVPYDAIAAMVNDLAGSAVSEALVNTVATATEGNPLFVEELTEHLAGLISPTGEGLLHLPVAALPVPVNVADTVAQRVAALSDEAATLVRTGAVLGRSFDPVLAARLGGLANESLLAAAEDALLSGLVNEVSARELSFSHGLVQSAVYHSLSGPRRLDTHRRAAQELGSQTGSATASGTPSFEIAHHWAVVARSDPTASGKAGLWARRAGDDAAAAADITEAVRRYRDAVGLLGDDDPERCETLLRLGAALSASGQSDDADAAFWPALGLARSLSDPPRFARAAIGLASGVRYGRSDPARIDALETALAWLDAEGEEVLATMVAAMLKRQLGFDTSEDAYLRRQRAARLVLDAVSRPDLSDELLVTLGAARDAIMVDDPRVLARLSSQTVRAGVAARRLHVQAHGWYGSAWAALELADADGWRRATEQFRTVADELDLPFELALAATMAATTAMVEGRYPDAVSLAEQAYELGQDADPNAATIKLTNAVITGFDLGDGPAMVQLMDASRDELAQVPTFLAGFAVIAALSGSASLAAELLGQFATAGFDNVRRDLEWLPVIGFLSHTAAALGATDHARGLSELLAGHPARAVRVGPLAGWWGPTEFHLGLLCRLLGRPEEAEQRLRSALDTCAALAARPWLARCQLQLAELIDPSGPTAALPGADRGEAADLRAAAVATIAELGAAGIALLR